MNPLIAPGQAVQDAYADVQRLTQELHAAERRLKATIAAQGDAIAAQRRGPSLFGPPDQVEGGPSPLPSRPGPLPESATESEKVSAPLPAEHPGRQDVVMERDRVQASPLQIAWAAVAAECPAGIDRLQHQSGKYVHWSTSDGSVACCSAPPPPAGESKPTPAQEAAWLASQSISDTPTWEQRCRFRVTLADGQEIRCAYDPGRGVLTMEGAALCARGFLQHPVSRGPATEGLRSAPLEGFARMLAQTAADQHASSCRAPRPGSPPGQTAGASQVKEPSRRKRKKEVGT